MTVQVSVISTFLEDTFRKVKAYVYGKDDVQTPDQAAPYGVDSNPIADMIGIYAETAEVGEPVIVGYINQDQLAAPGEIRLYSTDGDAGLKGYIWLKADGTYQIGGTAHNAVRYTPLNSGLQNLVTALQTELGLIATGISNAGGSYVPGTLSLDISGAKINEIKTL